MLTVLPLSVACLRDNSFFCVLACVRRVLLVLCRPGAFVALRACFGAFLAFPGFRLVFASPFACFAVFFLLFPSLSVSLPFFLFVFFLAFPFFCFLCSPSRCSARVARGALLGLRFLSSFHPCLSSFLSLGVLSPCLRGSRCSRAGSVFRSRVGRVVRAGLASIGQRLSGDSRSSGLFRSVRASWFVWLSWSAFVAKTSWRCLSCGRSPVVFRFPGADAFRPRGSFRFLGAGLFGLTPSCAWRVSVAVFLSSASCPLAGLHPLLAFVCACRCVGYRACEDYRFHRGRGWFCLRVVRVGLFALDVSVFLFFSRCLVRAVEQEEERVLRLRSVPFGLDGRLVPIVRGSCLARCSLPSRGLFRVVLGLGE